MFLCRYHVNNRIRGQTMRSKKGRWQSNQYASALTSFPRTFRCLSFCSTIWLRELTKRARPLSRSGELSLRFGRLQAILSKCLLNIWTNILHEEGLGSAGCSIFVLFRLWWVQTARSHWERIGSTVTRLSIWASAPRVCLPASQVLLSWSVSTSFQAWSVAKRNSPIPSPCQCLPRYKSTSLRWNLVLPIRRGYHSYRV